MWSYHSWYRNFQNIVTTGSSLKIAVVAIVSILAIARTILEGKITNILTRAQNKNTYW